MPPRFLSCKKPNERSVTPFAVDPVGVETLFDNLSSPADCVGANSNPLGLRRRISCAEHSAKQNVCNAVSLRCRGPDGNRTRDLRIKVHSRSCWRVPGQASECRDGVQFVLSCVWLQAQ